MRKRIVGAAVIAVLSVGFATPAFAASNPSGSGQPSQSCGSAGATSEPGGFGTGGFSTAEAVYAGSEGTPSLANGSSTAVSQYDVACYQVTSAGR